MKNFLMLDVQASIEIMSDFLEMIEGPRLAYPFPTFAIG
jgi:hypothetical protein